MNHIMRKSTININIQDRVYQHEKKIFICRMKYYIYMTDCIWGLDTSTASVVDIKKTKKYQILMNMWKYIHDNIIYFINFINLCDTICRKIDEFKCIFISKSTEMVDAFDLVDNIKKIIHIHTHKCCTKTLTGLLCKNNTTNLGGMCNIHTRYYKDRENIIIYKCNINMDVTGIIMDYLIE